MGAEFYLSTCTYFCICCTGIAYIWLKSTVVVKGLTYKLCKCVWPCLCVVNLPYYVCMFYWNYRTAGADNLSEYTLVVKGLTCKNCG